MKSLKISVHVYTLQLVGWVFIRLNIEHVDKLINDKFINSFEILVTCASDNGLWRIFTTDINLDSDTIQKRFSMKQSYKERGKKQRLLKINPPKSNKQTYPNKEWNHKGKNQKIEFNFLDLFIFLMYIVGYSDKCGRRVVLTCRHYIKFP